MEVENQSTFISQMLQDIQAGVVDEETTISFKEDSATPMTMDKSAPGDVIELSDEFDFEGYQVVRREFFAHTFEPSITFNNYKIYVNTACLNKFPHADCAQLLINRASRILALRPCAESERDAFAWCNTSGGKRKPRQITGKMFFAKLFELMDWIFNSLTHKLFLFCLSRFQGVLTGIYFYLSDSFYLIHRHANCWDYHKQYEELLC